ncbi:hypothetical protein GCM10020256_72900 [Streptomyces thermocoprophilus]
MVRTRVASSDWWASRKVVSVTPRVGASRSRAGEALGAEFGEELPGAGGYVPGGQRGQFGQRVDQVGAGAVRLVDGDVGEIGEQFGAAVGGVAGRQQVRALLDERGGDLAGLEVGVVEDGLEEGDVGGDAADAELGDRAPGPVDGGGEVAAPAGELHQHGVEVGADLRTGVGGAAVEADAGAAGRAVGADAAGVGAEAVGGVLGGDTALERCAAQPHRVLGEAEVGEGLSGGDAQLGLDEVDVGDLLGDGVLDLDARVHLDEDVVAVAVEEELDGARVAVADLPGEADGVGADAVAQLGGEAGGGRQFDDLLVPSLHRAVAFVEVDDIAGAVGEDLHLDVAGFDDGFLQEDRRVAEGGGGLAGRRFDGLAEPVGVLDAAHAAPAAARDGLHEHGEADGVGGADEFLDVGGGRGGAEHGDAGLAGGGDGAGLVAGEFEDVGAGADEGDAGLFAGARQVGVLGEKP